MAAAVICAEGAVPDDALDRLRRRLDRYQQRRARRAGWTRRFVPTGVSQLDTLLPRGGLPRGAITELLSEGPGLGAMSLALRIAVTQTLPLEEGCEDGECDGRSMIEHLTLPRPLPEREGSNPPRSPIGKGGGNFPRSFLGNGEGGFILVVDTLGDFYPPEAARRGVALDRLIVVRPAGEREAVWATDHSLRCPAVGVVIAMLNRLDERGSRKLQLAAESSGVVGVILRPSGRQEKSFAAVRMLIEGVPARHDHAVASPLVGDVERRPAPPTRGGAAAGGGAMQAERPLPHGRGSDQRLARVTLLKVREGMPTGPVVVDLHHETHALPVYPLPAHRPVVQTGT